MLIVWMEMLFVMVFCFFCVCCYGNCKCVCSVSVCFVVGVGCDDLVVGVGGVCVVCVGCGGVVCLF